MEKKEEKLLLRGITSIIVHGERDRWRRRESIMVSPKSRYEYKYS